MSRTTRPGVRWAVPAGVTALVLGGAVAGPALSAAADVELPERSAAQLLVDLQTADVDAFSGAVVHRADLGLPALPDGMGDREHSTDLSSLLEGEHELLVWASGHRGRIAITGDLGEYGVVSDGTDVWTWSSDENTATHLVLPEHDGDPGWAGTVPQVTPGQLADHVLRSLEPTTTVTTGPTDMVAGRPAYELVVEPAGGGSLIGAVRIAVDAEAHVATRVQVVPAGSRTPALDVAFTRLSLETPDDSMFAFTPPPGATVEERTVPDHRVPGSSGDRPSPRRATAGGLGTAGLGMHAPGDDRVAVLGRGWSAVLVARLPDGTDATAVGEALGSDARAFLGALPRVTGDWGSGRLATSRLFSALLTDDGRLLVGAVDGDALQAAAGDPAGTAG